MYLKNVTLKMAVSIATAAYYHRVIQLLQILLKALLIDIHFCWEIKCAYHMGSTVVNTATLFPGCLPSLLTFHPLEQEIGERRHKANNIVKLLVLGIEGKTVFNWQPTNLVHKTPMFTSRNSTHTGPLQDIYNELLFFWGIYVSRAGKHCTIILYWYWVITGKIDWEGTQITFTNLLLLLWLTVVTQRYWCKQQPTWS